MGFVAIIRHSVTKLLPVASRLARVQRCNCSALFSVPSRSSLAHGPRLWPSVGVLEYSTGGKSLASDQSLLSAIDSEIKSAEGTEDHALPVEETPSGFPFELQDNPGQRTVTLSRAYQGEDIKVEVHMPAPAGGEDSGDVEDNYADEDADEKPHQSSLPLLITVTKRSGLGLEFSCTAFPDEIVIDGLAVRYPEDSPEEQIPYEGPDFQDLDENLRKGFHKYLEIRGIKPSTTNFLHEYMVHKDSREFVGWLNNVRNFIDS